MYTGLRSVKSLKPGCIRLMSSYGVVVSGHYGKGSKGLEGLLEIVFDYCYISISTPKLGGRVVYVGLLGSVMVVIGNFRKIYM